MTANIICTFLLHSLKGKQEVNCGEKALETGVHGEWCYADTRKNMIGSKERAFIINNVALIPCAGVRAPTSR